MKRVAVIEGEDAAPEAMRPTLALLDRLDLDIEWILSLARENEVVTSA